MTEVIPCAVYESIIGDLAASTHLNLQTHDILLFGGGGMDRSFYRSLGGSAICEVLWTGSCGPWWARVLSRLIPGQAGLLRATSPAAVADLFTELSAYSRSTLLYVPKQVAERTVVAVMAGHTDNLANYVASAPDSFVIEADSNIGRDREGTELCYYRSTVGASVADELRRILGSPDGVT